MVLLASLNSDLQLMNCPLHLEEELLSQGEEFKSHGIVFTSEGNMEQEIDRHMKVASAVLRMLKLFVDRAKLEGEARNLMVFGAQVC